MSTVPPPPPQPPGPPFTSWGRLGLQPDSSLYITKDDRIMARFRSSNAVNLTIRARVQQPEDGRVVPFNFAFSTNGSRQAQLQVIEASEGFLLGVEILTSSTGVTRGVLYCELSLLRGGITATDRVQKLCAGYVETGQTITWPGGDFEDPLESQGRIRRVIGLDPAAGAEVTETVPVGARYYVRGIRFTLVTDATAVVRRVHVILDDGTTTLLDLAAADTQAASLTRNYNCASCGFQRAAQDSEIYIPFPADVRLPANFRVRTVTTNLQAGDNFGLPQLWIEEWLEE